MAKKHIHSFSGVYLIANKQNGKEYIGSSRNIRYRVMKHFGALRRKKHCNHLLQADWDIYGKDNFTYEVIEICRDEVLRDREQLWMDGLLPAYNIFKDSKGAKGTKHNPQTRLKISQAKKGKPSFRKGFKCSESTIEKMRAANLGKKYSKEVNLKKGSKGEKNPSWGKGLPVVQYDLNGVFISSFVNAHQAANSIGIRIGSNILKCCDKKIKYSYGYKWEYKI